MLEHKFFTEAPALAEAGAMQNFKKQLEQRTL
jgi:hypothetical protein